MDSPQAKERERDFHPSVGGWGARGALKRPNPMASSLAASSLLHGVCIGAVLLAGWYSTATLPATAVTVDLDITPSVLIAKGNSPLDVASAEAPPSPTPRERARLTAVAVTLPAAPTDPPAAPAALPVPVLAPAATPSPVQPGEVTAAVPAPVSGAAGGPAQPGPDGSALGGAALGGAREAAGGTARPNETEAEAGGTFAPPGYRSGERPAYPPQARQEGWSGAVTLRILVDISGTPAEVTVRSGTGHDLLDQAAARAVRQWRFSPAKKRGQPIASFHDVRVRFRLDDAR